MCNISHDVTSVTENGSCNVSHVSIREAFLKLSFSSFFLFILFEIEDGVADGHWMAK